MFTLLYSIILLFPSVSSIYVSSSVRPEDIVAADDATHQIANEMEMFALNDIFSAMHKMIEYTPSFVIASSNDSPKMIYANTNARVDRLESQMKLLLMSVREFQLYVLLSLFLISTVVGCILCTRRRNVAQSKVVVTEPLDAATIVKQHLRV